MKLSYISIVIGLAVHSAFASQDLRSRRTRSLLISS